MRDRLAAMGGASEASVACTSTYANGQAVPGTMGPLVGPALVHLHGVVTGLPVPTRRPDPELPPDPRRAVPMAPLGAAIGPHGASVRSAACSCATREALHYPQTERT